MEERGEGREEGKGGNSRKREWKRPCVSLNFPENSLRLPLELILYNGTLRK